LVIVVLPAPVELTKARFPWKGTPGDKNCRSLQIFHNFI